MTPPVIIIHYHLQPGGVTKVIESQVDALNSAGIDYLILTGQEYTGERGLKQIVIPQLAYYEESKDKIKEGAELYQACLEAMYLRFGHADVLWILHNPTLGKNVLYPELIQHLSYNKDKALFLCHDFAEDGRPTNYQLTFDSKRTYPIAENIFYGLINSRDQERLIQAGVPQKQIHLLPNPASPHDAKRTPYLPLKKTVLYPVRGIRRKNLGEFLLWSVLAPENTEFVLSLAPENQKWLPYYEVWTALAQELNLPVILGNAGEKNAPENEAKSFEEWLSTATHCITTSIAEGFGFTFLEPQLLNIPLIGRDLPDITRDFKNQGINLWELYEKILVPFSAVDLEELRQELQYGLEFTYYSYGIQYREEYLEEAWQALTNDGHIDFGSLPEHYQVDIIIKVFTGELIGLRVQLESGETIMAQDWMKNALSSYGAASHQDGLDYYSLSAYQERLCSTLDALVKAPRSAPTWLNKNDMLQPFLTPEEFHFLRT